MVDVKISYELIPVSDKEYKVIKYSNNFPVIEYTITKKKSWRCNCISGKIRNYCHHKDWLSNLKSLPSNVKLVLLIDGEKLRASVLKQLVSMKNKRKVERAEKRG